jgi:predicted HTH domain antitoxin
MLTIPAEYIKATRMTEAELLLEVAVMLFQKEKLSLGQAARLAGIPQYRFQMLLASRGISLHYDVEEFREDVETLKRLRP